MQGIVQMTNETVINPEDITITIKSVDGGWQIMPAPFDRMCAIVDSINAGTIDSLAPTMAEQIAGMMLRYADAVTANLLKLAEESEQSKTYGEMKFS